MRSFMQTIWVLVMLVPILCLADEQSVSKEATRRLEMIRASEDIIEFYGRVVDQYGQPVEGVAVVIRVGQATLLPKAPLELRVVSNSKGEFGIDPKNDTIKGGMLSIGSIEKDGYEFKFSQGEKWGFDYRKNNPQRFVPNKTDPVVFHMRKKELAPIFLFQEVQLDFQVQANKSGKPLGYDFIRRHRIKDTHNLVFDGEPLDCDIQVKATFDTKSTAWSVALSSGITNGGIIASEQLLYEAPEDGYQPEYTFIPEDHKTPAKKYIYLRSRDPAIYTRYEIEYVNANKEFFRLSGKSMTNPYGDRNLEQATDLPYEVTKQLTDEVKTAFRQNKRPSKPDLKALITAEKEKNKQPE